MTQFKELLEIIKKYDGNGADYTRYWEESGNGNTGEVFEEAEVYKIFSPELKTEIQSLLLSGKNGIIYTSSGIDGGKWYEYEKGEGDRPDQFSIQDKPKDNQNNEEKCDICGSAWDGKGCWEYLVVDSKTYCNSCANKLAKKSEIEEEQDKLNALKNKLQNSSNPAERESLKDIINKTENHLKDLKNQRNRDRRPTKKSGDNSEPSNQPHKGEWKLFLVGAVTLSAVSAVILVLVAVIKKARKKPWVKK